MCLKPEINLISLVTSNFSEMSDFYANILSFPVKIQMDSYIEFEMIGVRFSITTSEVMKTATAKHDFQAKKESHSFELAFNVVKPDNVDKDYKVLLAKGVRGIKEPQIMPWNQRTAFFSDPDNNIHEIFAEL